MTDDPVAALADLSLVEHRLAEIRQDLARLHQTLEGSPAIGDGRSRRAVADARRADLQRRLRDAEQQERTERARARTHESQLYSGTIHNPRELSQLAGELEQLKGRLALEEVAEMELLSELDEADAELRGATDEAAEARRALAERESAFVKDVHDEACTVFGTTLGPAANAAHKNHFHLDMKARRHSGFCE